MPANGRWDLIRRLKVKCSSVTKTSRLMLCNEIIAVCYENRMKQVRSTYTYTYTQYIHIETYVHAYINTCILTHMHYVCNRLFHRPCSVCGV